MESYFPTFFILDFTDLPPPSRVGSLRASPHTDSTLPAAGRKVGGKIIARNCVYPIAMHAEACMVVLNNELGDTRYERLKNHFWQNS